MSENLWGDLPDASNIRTPYAVLKEQASFLEQSTKGLLNGALKSATEGDFTVVSFYIRAPALNNYAYQILSIRHKITLYPLNVIDVVSNRVTNCADEAALLNELGKIFKLDRTRDVIRGLLAQINAEAS